MRKELIQSLSKFLLSEYKACLEDGVSETPEHFLMRMRVDSEVETHVLPDLEKMKNKLSKMTTNDKQKLKKIMKE